jgi:YbgC/YbaW family acyl-CoA thioester hydrolase
MPPEARAAAEPAGRTRSIRRRLHLTPAFHQVDMMQVVHNVQFFYWFELGRTRIMEEFMSLEASLQLGVAMPVVENQCLYRKPVRYGDPLVLLTEHRCLSAWAGRLVFSHSLVHRKLKTEVACGRTTTTLIELATGRLVKEWPEDLWRRYLALADGDQSSQPEI